MSLLQAILMGVIQGITEFLPVSSSGHLAIFKNIFHVNMETGMLYDVLLHLGTLIAIFAVYYKDIWKMIVEGCSIVKDAVVNTIRFFQNQVIYLQTKDKTQFKPYQKMVTNSYRKFVMLVIVSTIPTGIIGIVGSDLVEMASEILIVPGICLIVTAVLLYLAEHTADGEKTPKQVTYANAFSIGIAQGIATLPGLSRSGTTIAACMLSGFNRNFAVKYSFIMSIPAVLGAVVKELLDATSLEIPKTEIYYYIIGTVIAAVVGYVCIKTMLVVVRKKKFTAFSIYCFLVGTISIVGYFFV